MSTELLQKLEKAVADERALNQKLADEVKKFGAESAESKAQAEKATAALEKVQDELKKVQTAMARNAADGGDGGEQKAEQKKISDAFQKFMRKGEKGMNDAEHKSLSVQVDSDGGYLVRPEVSSEIVKFLFESSPMRQLASVQQISTDSLEINEDLDEPDADWVGEKGSRSETGTPELAKIVIPVHEMYANPAATQKILDDAAINMESWLQEHVQGKFARLEATGFVAGNGVNKPKGILSYSAYSGTGSILNTLEQVASGNATALTADGLINLVYSLKAGYKQGAAFMMKRATVAAIRKFKDTTNQYLWQPSLQLGQPDMLLGFPIYEADDMQAQGANALAVAFGNFKAGYQIVDRIGIRVLRDPFTNKPYVHFYTTKRVGGGVKNFEAIKIQKCST